MANITGTVMDIYDSVRESTSGYLYKFIVAIVLLLVGFILGRILGRLMYKFLHSFEVNSNFSKLSGVTVKIEEIAETFTAYFIYFITIVIVLQQIGLATTILHMIAGGVIILLILSTFLGIKDFIPNAMAGFVMQRRKTFRVGQVIKVKGMMGKITRITLVETKIQTKEGDMIFIPNSVLSKTEVIYVASKKTKRKKGKASAASTKRPAGSGKRPASDDDFAGKESDDG
ncbi:TPA: mechanosensitive ion channel [Candidatus Woesearchaeota archaeon]|nr:mechanosensitive ion channel [Candidatus Woesearchaeota archaeon]